MTGAQIITEIERYLDDAIYNYAVLIDGEWGSGKTYFVKNSLKKAIVEHVSKDIDNKRMVKYISLYGCKDVNDLQERLIWEFVDEGQKALRNKKKQGKVNKNNERTDEIASTAVTSVRKICGGVLKKLLPDSSIYDFAWDWIQLKSCVFIFDDLERCNCPLNEVFGFINELVEHEETKVIIVANEREISYVVSPENIEQQYMISVSDKIAWPKYEKDNSIYSAMRTRESSGKISIDELEARRISLFPSEESNGDYKKIREKLIGITLKFDSDISEITRSIVKNADYDEKIKEIVTRKLDYMEGRMDFYGHHNLRTVQFFLSKVSYLLLELRQIEIDNEYRMKMEDYVLTECLEACVRYKGNYQTPRNDLAYLSSSDTHTSKAILEFVEKGQYAFSTYEMEMKDIVQNVYKNNVDASDPYNILHSGYYYLTQKECEEKYAEMISRLEGNKYPTSIYEDIIILAARLETIGFPSANSDRIAQALVNNLQTIPNVNEFKVDLYFVEDPKIRETVLRYVQQINEELRLRLQNIKKRTVQEILESEDWIESLGKLIKSAGDRYARDIAVFSQAVSSVWVKNINTSSSKDIHAFRSWMWDLYPQNYVKKSFDEDWPTLLEIHDALEPEREEDLIKRQALGYVVWQIEETYKINKGEPYLKSQEVESGEAF